VKVDLFAVEFEGGPYIKTILPFPPAPPTGIPPTPIPGDQSGSEGLPAYPPPLPFAAPAELV
jgi:hypothetical protein